MRTVRTRIQEGSAIVVVCFVMFTLAVTAAISMEYTATIRHHVQRSDALQSAISVGDGALENAFSNWREVCRANSSGNPATSSFTTTTVPLPTQSQFPNVTNFTASALPADLTAAHPPTVSNYSIVALDPEYNVMDPNTAPIPNQGPGSASATYNYMAQADVALPVLGDKVVAKVRRIFQNEQLSPWNWAIFYVDPLEIHPGSLMNINGWVHTNSNLYTGHNYLHFLDKVTYSSDWFVGFRPGDPRAVGGSTPETPTAPSYPNGLPPAYDVAHQPFGLDATRIWNTTDANPNNDSYHELIEPPVAGYTDPVANQRYYDQAGVKISIDASNNITIKDLNNVTLSSSSTGYALTLYNTFKNALTTNQSIQDNREGASVRLATLDVGAVSSKIRDGTLSGFNGIIYIRDSSAGATGGTPKRGIRLKNGQIMPAGGFTIASDNPIYVQGDYNTGGSNPPSNSGDPTTPQVSGYTRQPCAIIGDSVNVLSNAWTDSKASQDLSQRVASNTTVNAAFVAGIVQSANNVYSGGAENFPRFLEDWGSKTFTYYGAMVELYQSRQGIGSWGSANVYGAPGRQWYFDPNFKVNAPKGSLLVYTYVKGRWFLAQ